MKIVFFGTPFFAAEVLKYLIDKKFDIVAVVTQPDRPKGRSLQIISSDVKVVASSNNIHVYQPEKASSDEFIDQINSYNADLFVVVAFGQILSQKILDTPKKGCINLHASLLPKYRGAAPIHRAILNGDKETGVCVQKMVRKMDAGDVIDFLKVDILPEMNFQELELSLIEASKHLLEKVLKKYQVAIPNAFPQDEKEVTYAPKVELEEGQILWSKKTSEILNLVRAFTPKPGAWAWIQINGEMKRLKIFKIKIVESGQLPEVIPCSDGFIQLLEVQPEGKKVMKALDWIRGQKNIQFFF